MNGKSQADLRRQAQRMLSGTEEEFRQLTEKERASLVHELRVHQIELELQNEELRGAQLEITHLRDHYENLFEFAPIGYLILDELSMIQQANFTACRLLELERSRLSGRRFLTFLSIADQDVWRKHFEATFADPERRHTCRVTVSFGNRKAALRLESTVDPSGDPSKRRQCRTALIDITLEQEVERWKQQAHLLQQMVENWPAGAIFVDHGQIQLNRAAELICGYSRAELQTVDQWFSRLYREREDEVRRLYVTLRSQGFPDFWPAMPIRRKDGAIRVVRFAAQAFDHHEIWLLYDLTELVKAEEQLRRSQFTIDHSQEAILWVRRDGTLVYANTAAHQFKGFSAAELHRMLLSEIHPGRREGRDRLEWTVPDEHGLPRVFEATIDSMQYGEEEFSCVYLRDVTGRRRAEIEIARATELDQLRIAQELHDSFGSLLTGIDCLSTGLTRDLTRKAMREEAGRAEEISRQIRDAIVQVRLLVKGLHPLEGDFNQLEQAMHALAIRINSLGKIKCRYLSCPEELPPLKPKVANQLFRIAQEASHNAVRHSGGTHLTIHLKVKDNAILLTVTDNGCGFEIGELKTTGFGLRTMQHRADSMGGSLRIQNRRTGGICVTCRVARDHALAGEPAPEGGKPSP